MLQAIEFFRALDFPTTGSREEDIRLAMLAQSGDMAARDRLILANIGVVILIAQKKQDSHCRVELCDLISEGVLGVIRAIERYDPDKSKGGRFIQYAKYWIILFMNTSIHECHLFKVPRGTLQMYKYSKTYKASRWVAAALEAWRDASNRSDAQWEHQAYDGTDKDVQKWATQKYHDELLECIGELPKQQQDILFMILCGYERKEIYEVMAVTKGVFDGIYGRAMESLREMYSTIPA